MFGLSDSFTSWDIRRALTARGAGVGGWRSMDAKRVTAATARRRLEDSQQSACQTKPSSGRVYDGAPGGPALLSPCLSNQRAESSTTICCIVTWNCELELRTKQEIFCKNFSVTWIWLWLVCVIVEGKGDGYQSVLLVVLLSKRADKVKWFGRLALPPALIAGVLEKAVLMCVLRGCQGSGRGRWVSCRDHRQNDKPLMWYTTKEFSDTLVMPF